MGTDRPAPANDDQAERVRAWRDARKNTFDAWLERHHDRIVRIDGFRGLTFPHGDAGLVVRMATQEGRHAVMHLLNRASAIGVPVDWDRLELHLDETPLAEIPYVRGETPAQ